MQYPKVTLYYNRSEEFFNREEQQPLSLSQHFGRVYTASAVRSNNSTRICLLFKIPFPLSYHYNKYLTSMFCKFTCINF